MLADTLLLQHRKNVDREQRKAEAIAALERVPTVTPTPAATPTPTPTPIPTVTPTPVLERAALVRPEALDLVLVPCTAFDAACRRVGMGKGYYDRYLPGCRNAVALGVAFEAQRVDKAAVDAYDEKLDGFVTEGGLYFGSDTTEL